MEKAAIIVLADTETHEDLGRAVNALQVAREFKEAGGETTVVFDGAGTKWIPELSNPEHKAHKLFKQVEDVIAGACSYCANAFHVSDEIERSSVDFLDEFDGHPSVAKLVANGYEVITF